MPGERFLTFLRRSLESAKPGKERASLDADAFDEDLAEYAESILKDETLSAEEQLESIAPLISELVGDDCAEDVGRTLVSLWRGGEDGSIPPNGGAGLSKLDTSVTLQRKDFASSAVSAPAPTSTVAEFSPAAQRPPAQPVAILSGFIETRETSEIKDELDATDVRFALEKVSQQRSLAFNLRGVTLRYPGGVTILNNAHLHFEPGKRFALIGPNGCGKTSLLRHLAAGKIHGFPERLRTLLVRQEAKGELDCSATDLVLSTDGLYQKYKQWTAEPEGDQPPDLRPPAHEMAKYCHETEDRAAVRLRKVGFSSARKRAQPMESLSGGWRMRAALCAALFSHADLIMLDEPTNHLDLPGILWLQRELVENEDLREAAVVFVSHDREFVNAVATDVVAFANKKLKYSTGNLDDYSCAASERMKSRERQMALEEKKRDQLRKQVDQLKQQARRNQKKKGGNDLSGSIRSRKKMLEKVGTWTSVRDFPMSFWRFYNLAWSWGGDLLSDDERYATNLSLQLPAPPSLTSGDLFIPLLQLKDVSFHYPAPSPGEAPPLIVDHLDFDLCEQTTVVLLGANGLGKSTLMRLLGGELEPTAGTISRHKGLRVGHLMQHHTEQLAAEQTPMAYLAERFPGEHPDRLRAHLGTVGMAGRQAVQRMATLSGGEKVRILLAAITFESPHLLLLDEVSSHLDALSVAALAGALSAYEGSMVLASHDRWFTRSIIDPEALDEAGNSTTGAAAPEDHRKIRMLIFREGAPGEPAFIEEATGEEPQDVLDGYIDELTDSL